jgi:hypothetical protein
MSKQGYPLVGLLREIASLPVSGFRARWLVSRIFSASFVSLPHDESFVVHGHDMMEADGEIMIKASTH